MTANQQNKETLKQNRMAEFVGAFLTDRSAGDLPYTPANPGELPVGGYEAHNLREGMGMLFPTFQTAERGTELGLQTNSRSGTHGRRYMRNTAH